MIDGRGDLHSLYFSLSRTYPREEKIELSEDFPKEIKIHYSNGHVITITMPKSRYFKININNGTLTCLVRWKSDLFQIVEAEEYGEKVKGDFVVDIPGMGKVPLEEFVLKIFESLGLAMVKSMLGFSKLVIESK